MQGVTFVYPALFWALAIPFVIFAFLLSTNKDRLERIFDEKVLERLSSASSAVPPAVRNIILFAAIFLMIVSIARPVIHKGDKIVEVAGIPVVVALDISASMRSEDIYPNRLEFAKKKLLALFEKMPSDEIAMIAFAKAAFVLAPFTSDKATLGDIAQRVNHQYINMGSTDFGAMGELAAKMVEKKRPKILIVVSDGGDAKALEGFAAQIQKSGMDLYAVLVGSEKGAPVLDENGKTLTQKDGTIAISQRNDALGQTALDSGGAYVVAGNGKEDIDKLVAIIHSRYKAQEQGEVRIKDRVELFYYPLIGALLLLLIGFGSLPKRRSV